MHFFGSTHEEALLHDVLGTVKVNDSEFKENLEEMFTCIYDIR